MDKFLDVLDKAAAEAGLTREQLISKVLIGAFTSWRMWRAARRGDVARTVAYASVMIRMDMPKRRK